MMTDAFTIPVEEVNLVCLPNQEGTIVTPAVANVLYDCKGVEIAPDT